MNFGQNYEKFKERKKKESTRTSQNKTLTAHLIKKTDLWLRMEEIDFFFGATSKVPGQVGGRARQNAIFRSE